MRPHAIYLLALAFVGCNNDPIANAHVKLHLQHPDPDSPLETKSLVLLSRTALAGDTACDGRLFTPFTLTSEDFGTIVRYPLEDAVPFNSPDPDNPVEIFVYTYSQPLDGFCEPDGTCTTGTCTDIGLELKACAPGDAGAALEPRAGGCDELLLREDAVNDASITLIRPIPM